MSRSRKKHAITGMTCARSEKWDKRNINRKLRRRVKKQLSLKNDIDEAVLPVPNDIRTKWGMAKDGKQSYEAYKKSPDCERCVERLHCLVDESYKYGCRLWRSHYWYQRVIRK